MPKRAIPAVLIVLALALTFIISGQTPDPNTWRNPALPAEKRAATLVAQMTLQEKVLQMQRAAPAIERLGIPAYDWWNEGLHGVARAGEATVFPQAIGLAAMWDTGTMNRLADVISTEARAKYHDAIRNDVHRQYYGLTFWSPNINIFRDPRWGRGQETYGEDPFLTGRMAVAFIKGMQGDDPHYYKVIATAKHYAVHSGPESIRHSFNVNPSPRDYAETYLPAFRASVMEGKVDSIMCAYNAVDGVPACANTDLLQSKLHQWGFAGFIVSDCGAINDFYRQNGTPGHNYKPNAAESSAAAVKAGTDLTCGNEYAPGLPEAVKNGLIKESEIDAAMVRLFTARFKLGMFDPQERVKYSKIPISENDSDAHRQLALEAARKSIVLLKNDKDTLPLKANVKKIAVIGPSADDPVALLGNYNGFSKKHVTPLEGIQKQFAGKAEVRYALGAAYTPQSQAPIPTTALTPPTGTGHGLLAEYFDNPNFSGAPKLQRVEARVFQQTLVDPAVAAVIPAAPRPTPPPAAATPKGGTAPAPGRGGGRGFAPPPATASIRWTGSLTAPVTGDYAISGRAGGGFGPSPVHVFLDDKELVTPAPPPPDPAAASGGGAGRGAGPASPHVTLEAGHSYKLRVEYTSAGPGADAQLLWLPPADPSLAEAIDAVKNSDVAVAFVGLNPSLEGEEMRVNIPGFAGGDRTNIEIPEQQEKLVEAAIATGKPVVVVLTSGSALGANYAAQHAAALLELWYGGEESGTAIAETLVGINNPAGRLPVTFYKSVDQLPPFEDYSMNGRTYRYFKGEALYPFGFGLSYSKFEYSALRAERGPKGGQVSVRVKNASAREGDEVVQLYLAGAGGPDDVIRNLRGFQRIHLKAGESRDVQFTIALEDLPKDKTRISVGSGQPVGATAHAETIL